jgi:hypothetical protein
MTETCPYCGKTFMSRGVEALPESPVFPTQETPSAEATWDSRPTTLAEIRIALAAHRLAMVNVEVQRIEARLRAQAKKARDGQRDFTDDAI